MTLELYNRYVNRRTMFYRDYPRLYDEFLDDTLLEINNELALGTYTPETLPLDIEVRFNRWLRSYCLDLEGELKEGEDE